MEKFIKVFVVVENFKKDYPYHDGYVNSVFSSREKALRVCSYLLDLNRGRDYSCHVEDSDLLIDVEATVNLKLS